MNSKPPLLLCAIVALAAAAPFNFDVNISPTITQQQDKCCLSCESPKNMYFSIADDSGPFLCGQTCIRDSSYPVSLRAALSPHLLRRTLPDSYTWSVYSHDSRSVVLLAQSDSAVVEISQIFHLFEKNLTKTSSNTVCADAGYTIYNSTITHGGGGVYCTLDLYACGSSSGCDHP